MLLHLLKKAFSKDARKTAGIPAFESGADPGHADAHYQAGLAAAKCGRHDSALALFERAWELDPDNEDYLLRAGITHMHLGNNDKAWKCCEAALIRKPGLSLAHELMSIIALPGPPYFERLPQIHLQLRPRTYLEIGVESGRSLALAPSETRAIGIDPEPKIQFPLGARTSILTMKSDDYFATRDVRADFEGMPIDMAFLDGMHNFEFTLRDFINVEKHCARDSTILIHDCYPLDRATSGREQRTPFWSGDIWRLVVGLKKYRPDLHLHTIGTAPTGLGVVRNLDPGSSVLESRYDAITRECLALDFSVLDADKAGTLSLFPNEWEKIRVILR